jgi:hypothetical protein
MRVYGGVRNDLQWFESNRKNLAEHPDKMTPITLGFVFLAVDIPLCMAADTMTLPLTATFGIAKLLADEREKRSSPHEIAPRTLTSSSASPFPGANAKHPGD